MRGKHRRRPCWLGPTASPSSTHAHISPPALVPDLMQPGLRAMPATWVQVLGRGLAKLPRDQIVVATKVGWGGTAS